MTEPKRKLSAKKRVTLPRIAKPKDCVAPPPPKEKNAASRKKRVSGCAGDATFDYGVPRKGKDERKHGGKVH
jgi:hypothetical protein